MLETAEEPRLKIQGRLVEALRDPRSYPHAVGAVRVLETHISFVILTGAFAYKIKKAVDLGFLDFTTLEKRRFYCHEELRLNARLAPEIYLEVVPIGGAPEAPRVGEAGEAIEYAVKMREFPQQALADQALARGELTSRHIDALAELVAAFHAGAQRATQSDPYGSPETIRAWAMQNFSQIRAVSTPAQCADNLDALESWSRRECERLHGVFLQRKREARVRECHGDLHLGNLVLLDDRPQAFDCIEFNPELRWIDVMNEIAFLMMDLRAAGRADFAARLLSAYLESTGDYAGLAVLRFYLVYRAMVRAKVNLLRARQLEPAGARASLLEEQFGTYLALAQRFARPGRPFLVITHGFSGSGKTTLSQPLLELSGAIRLRSDVERKRMHGLAADARGGSGVGEGLYGAEATAATYGRLRDLARSAIEAGYGVIVDATFLKRAHRDLFRAVAASAAVPFLIVDFKASEALLRERVLARVRQGKDASDADLAVLEHQLATHEPLQDDELAATFVCDAAVPLARAQHPSVWRAALERLSPAPP
jgi:aminoglycoside phosphotransferase family enzyme/predicted kinase